MLLVELQRERASGMAPVDRRTTVGDLLRSWLGSRQGVVSDASYLRYESQVRLGLSDLHRIPVSSLTAEDIRAHLRGLSPAYAGSVLRILRAALTIAEQDGTVSRNVAKAVDAPRREPSPGIALTAQQVRHFLAVTKGEFRPLWCVLFGSGVRMGEALGLRWADVDIPGRRLYVTGSMRHQSKTTRGNGPRLQRQEPKTEGSRRITPLPTFAAAAVDAMPRDALFVFHRANGTPLNPSTVQRAFTAAIAAAGLPPIRLHDTRHAAATLWLASGASLDDVKRALGHSSIAITSDTYGHYVSERTAALADLMERAVG